MYAFTQQPRPPIEIIDPDPKYQRDYSSNRRFIPVVTTNVKFTNNTEAPNMRSAQSMSGVPREVLAAEQARQWGQGYTPPSAQQQMGYVPQQQPQMQQQHLPMHQQQNYQVFIVQPVNGQLPQLPQGYHYVNGNANGLYYAVSDQPQIPQQQPMQQIPQYQPVQQMQQPNLNQYLQQSPYTTLPTSVRLGEYTALRQPAQSNVPKYDRTAMSVNRYDHREQRLGEESTRKVEDLHTKTVEFDYDTNVPATYGGGFVLANPISQAKLDEAHRKERERLAEEEARLLELNSMFNTRPIEVQPQMQQYVPVQEYVPVQVPVLPKVEAKIEEVAPKPSDAPRNRPSEVHMSELDKENLKAYRERSSMMAKMAIQIMSGYKYDNSDDEEQVVQTKVEAPVMVEVKEPVIQDNVVEIDGKMYRYVAETDSYIRIIATKHVNEKAASVSPVEEVIQISQGAIVPEAAVTDVEVLEKAIVTIPKQEVVTIPSETKNNQEGAEMSHGEVLSNRSQERESFTYTVNGKTYRADNRVHLTDRSNGNTRSYKSVTEPTPFGDKPHIYTTAKDSKNGFKTLISVSVSPADGLVPSADRTAPYECRTQYFNRSNMDVKITDKQNVSFTVKKNRFVNANQEEHFIVRKIHTFNDIETARSVLIHYQNEKEFLAIEDGERKMILDEINGRSNCGDLKSFSHAFSLTVDRLIPISLFNAYSSIYVADLDVMFTQENLITGTPHPTSRDAVVKGEIARAVECLKLSGTLFDAVDNESEHLHRYICVGKEVHSIPVIRDANRISGLYMYDIRNTNVDDMRSTIKHIPFDKGEEYGIYPNKEEAANKGLLNDTIKREFNLKTAEIELKNTLLERENVTLKQEVARENTRREEANSRRESLEKEAQHLRAMEKIHQEREAYIEKANQERQDSKREEAERALAHQRAMDEIKAERLAFVEEQQKREAEHNALMKEIAAKMKMREESDKTESNSQQRKDYFEERSYVRKDTSEFMKWAPALITFLMGIGTTIAMARSKQS